MTTPPDDPLEPPDYGDYAENEAERHRLRWAWRDGFEAGAAWFAARSKEALAEIRQALADVPGERPVPCRDKPARPEPPARPILDLGGGDDGSTT